MSGPVDVLAYHARGMRAAAESKGLTLTANGCAKLARDLESVSAAMAELTAAANRARSILALHDDRCPQLDAAIANVGGAE